MKRFKIDLLIVIVKRIGNLSESNETFLLGFVGMTVFTGLYRRIVAVIVVGTVVRLRTNTWLPIVDGMTTVARSVNEPTPHSKLTQPFRVLRRMGLPSSVSSSPIPIAIPTPL